MTKSTEIMHRILMFMVGIEKVLTLLLVHFLTTRILKWSSVVAYTIGVLTIA